MAQKRAAKTAERPAVEKVARPEDAEQESQHTGRSVPVLVPEVHVRHVPVHAPGVPRVHMPVPQSLRDRFPDVANNRVLWLGGLAVLAVTEVITWPVAGVVAAGVYVAEQRAKAARESSTEEAKGEAPDNEQSGQ